MYPNEGMGSRETSGYLLPRAWKVAVPVVQTEVLIKLLERYAPANAVDLPNSGISKLHPGFMKHA